MVSFAFCATGMARNLWRHCDQWASNFELRRGFGDAFLERLGPPGKLQQELFAGLLLT